MFFFLAQYRDASSSTMKEPIDFKGLELGQTLGLESSSDRLNGLTSDQPPSVNSSENDLSSPMNNGNVPLTRVPSTPYNFDGVDDDDEDEMDTMNTDELLHHTVHK